MIKGWIRFIVLFLSELPIQIIGLLVGIIAIPFRRVDTTGENDGEPRIYTQYPQHGRWIRVRLPKWALWWDNPYDGLLGDKRGWWANRCRESGRTEHDFISMYIWSMVRNPANHFSRKVTGCDVSDCKIEKVAGNADYVNNDALKDKALWQVLLATDSKGKTYPRLVALVPWSDKYCMEVNIGWKLELYYNGTSKNEIEQLRYKGNTLRLKFFVKRKN